MAATAAAGLIKALSGSKAVKATANFAKGMKSIEETEKMGGFNTMENVMNSIQSAAGAPGMVPLQVLMAELQSQTVEAQVKLMQTLLEQLEKPGVQTAITAIADLISLLLESLGTVIGWIGDIGAFLGEGAPGLARPSADPVNVYQQHGSYFAGLEALGDTGTTGDTVPSTRYQEY